MVEVLSDIGTTRMVNEDYLSYYEGDKSLYVIADGMGGHNGGEIASKTATEILINGFKSEFSSDEDCLRSLIIEANEKVYKLSLEREVYTGMGTTITACIKNGNDLTIGNVGDSSLFIVKDKVIKKVTKDNSYVQELLDSGKITLEESKNHPKKNLITRAIGTSPSIIVDIYKINLSNVRYIILCTDGLSNWVNPFDIINTLNKNDIKEATSILIEKAKLNGSKDNISVILVKGDEK